MSSEGFILEEVEKKNSIRLKLRKNGEFSKACSRCLRKAKKKFFKALRLPQELREPDNARFLPLNKKYYCMHILPVCYCITRIDI